jgi:tetratricopeptide (TPR) repeat protein
MNSLLILLIFFSSSALHSVNAQGSNLQPKFGPAAKSETQQAADRKFIESMDGMFKGDRKKASDAAAARGWQYLRQGNLNDAMRRFNQSWLLNNANGSAIWGMAAIQGSTEGKSDEALGLFAEAEKLLPNDIDLAVDYAKTIGFSGVETKNKQLIQDALNRHAKLYEKSPAHLLNLQNWSILLYYLGNYPEAWKKIKLAEALPRHAELDQDYIRELNSKMRRP